MHSSCNKLLGCVSTLTLYFCTLTDIVATVDSSRTGVLSTYYIQCKVLISEGASRCDCCKTHRKFLCAMASHHCKNEQTDPSNDTDHISVTEFKQDYNVEQSQEKQPPGLEISLPILAYIDAPAGSVNNLQDRLQR